MLIFFAVFILTALLLQWYSVRNAADHSRIRYECKPSVRAGEPGEEFVVFSTVSNIGRRATPLLRIEEYFPNELNVCEAEQFSIKITRNERRIYRSTAVVRGRQQVERSLRASISKRGEYCFSYAEFHSGDFLGLREFDYDMPNENSIVIYPPRITDGELVSCFTSVMDELARRQMLLEDPLSVRGYREYTGREPMRQISWLQSAVRNSLVVKQFDPVWQQSVCVVLDMQYHGDFDNHFKRQELCFAMARTVCDMLEDRHMSYNLVTNAVITGGIASFSSTGGKGEAYARILYALGSASNGEVCPLSELATAACTGAERQRTLLLISTRRCEETACAVKRIEALNGGEVMTLYADEILTDELESLVMGNAPESGEAEA